MDQRYLFSIPAFRSAAASLSYRIESRKDINLLRKEVREGKV